MESPSFKEKLKLANHNQSYPWRGNEKEQNAVLLAKIENAKTQRRQPFRRFDNLDFETDYQANEDAITAFLRPKKNDDEVRVNTGTTEKKGEVIINEISSYNFQPEIFAFDRENLEIQELGDDTADLVRKTNEMENDEDKLLDGLFEFIGQRAVFFEEYVEEKILNNRLIKQCKKRMLSALQVFLGDLTLPSYRFQEQPYIVKYDKLNYWTAKMYFGHLPNWKYVYPGEQMQEDWYGGDFNYRLGRLDDMEIETMKYESAVDREYQLWINGVPMYKFGTKLPWEHEGYNTVMGIVKRLAANLAYGRPVVASLKYLQGLKDEIVRNLIRKFRQAVDPPKAVAGTGKIYSKDIFEAGKLTYGIAPNTMSNLVDHQGITQSDVEMLEIINRIADEFASSSAIQQGIQEQRRETATAIIEQRKHAVKMLGLIVINWTRVIRDLTFLRTYNLFENFSKPTGKDIDPLTQEIKDVYERFTIKNTSLSNERLGTKVINFTDRSLTEQEEDSLYEFEKQQAEQGNNLEIKFVNVKLLQQVKAQWHVVVVPKPKEDSALHQMMFAEKFQQGAQVSQAIGEALNPGKWKQEYEQTWKVKDAFAPAPPLGLQPQGMGEMGTEAVAGTKAMAKKPNMTAMLNA